MSDAGSPGSADRPIRTCIGCRTPRPQDELTRLHLDDGGRVALDRNGRGRGAWLCADGYARCLRQAVDRKALARAFRTEPDRASIERLLSASGDVD